ncbi:MAG: hypothetical protein E3J86_03215 [Candidatus Thorarchaeota archaeon]|nr:MAG: hypothetical protein E3J86_03215 [Candidatus Thorarchaeota archaeon]
MRKTIPDDVIYPQTSFEWRKWIEKKLNIDETQGSFFTENATFLHQRLVDLWNREFTAERGYSPDFIPALTRNKNGFLKWVYGGGSEPNWMKSD